MSSRGSSQSRDQTHLSYIAARLFFFFFKKHCATREAPLNCTETGSQAPPDCTGHIPYQGDTRGTVGERSQTFG